MGCVCRKGGNTRGTIKFSKKKGTKKFSSLSQLSRCAEVKGAWNHE